MPLPTLWVPGSIPGIDEVPIKHITSWIRQHMYEYGHQEATLNDRILIIKAETGSGKSTVMPVELFRLLRSKDTPIDIPYKGQKVLCTQPKILTAIELAVDVSIERSSFNPDMVMGKTVGYSTGSMKERAAGLMYVTAPTLRVKMNTNSDESIMDEYKFIVIDEAHERSVDADVLLFMLYKFYKKHEGNRKLPFLILTSATFEPIKYAKYFEISSNNIITVVGSSFKKPKIFLEHDTLNVYNNIIDTIITINKNNDEPEEADILVFVPGKKDMKTLVKLIEAKINGGAIRDYILVLQLDSEAVKKRSTDYQYVFETHSKLPKLNGKLPKRRVILSTTVAETGITIRTLKYVIDMGFHKAMESYPILNVRGILSRPSTKSRIEQRNGRVGRWFDGECYCMYTEETYNTLDKQQMPDILTSSDDYNSVHLLFYRLLDNEFSIEKLHLLDKPSQESFIGANSVATLLGFLDNKCRLTELGLIASRFSSMSMEGAKIIMSGFAFNVAISDLINIVALMQTQNSGIFMRDFAFKKNMQKLHKPYNIELPCNAQMIDYILPSYITDIIGGRHDKNRGKGKGQGNTQNVSRDPTRDYYYYRYKTIICDDFIETLLAFEAFNKVIIDTTSVKEVDNWCQTHCIDTTGIKTFYEEIRNRIMEDLLAAGIDTMYNSEYRLIDQPIDTFIQTIINIKQCLYEGLKHNILVYNEDERAYKTIHGLSISIDNSIMSVPLQNKLKAYKVLNNDIQPKYLLTDHLDLNLVKSGNMNDPEPYLYTISTNYVSILDGYINPDLSFGQPLSTKEEYKTYSAKQSAEQSARSAEQSAIDTIAQIHSFNKFNEDEHVKPPICSLNYNDTIFNNMIVEKIIAPICK
jgi:HrpA-like RNA helicase